MCSRISVKNCIISSFIISKLHTSDLSQKLKKYEFYRKKLSPPNDFLASNLNHAAKKTIKGIV